ncbi:MAG: hypothetical protein ABW321_06110 [Polyangiales bacterium]
MLLEVQAGDHFAPHKPQNQDGIIGCTASRGSKYSSEGDERYRAFLTAGKPDIAADSFATNVK